MDDVSVEQYIDRYGWACGAEAARIALATVGISVSEEDSKKGLQTGRSRGTLTKLFPVYMDSMGLTFTVSRNASIEELRTMFDLGFVMIVRYWMPQYNEDHYTVVDKIDDETVKFHDPYYGNSSMDLPQFNDIWGKTGDPTNPDTKWFIGIKKSIAYPE